MSHVALRQGACFRRDANNIIICIMYDLARQLNMSKKPPRQESFWKSGGKSQLKFTMRMPPTKSIIGIMLLFLQQLRVHNTPKKKRYVICILYIDTYITYVKTIKKIVIYVNFEILHIKKNIYIKIQTQNGEVRAFSSSCCSYYYSILQTANVLQYLYQQHKRRINLYFPCTESLWNSVYYCRTEHTVRPQFDGTAKTILIKPPIIVAHPPGLRCKWFRPKSCRANGGEPTRK